MKISTLTAAAILSSVISLGMAGSVPLPVMKPDVPMPDPGPAYHADAFTARAETQKPAKESKFVRDIARELAAYRAIATST